MEDQEKKEKSYHRKKTARILVSFLTLQLFINFFHIYYQIYEFYRYITVVYNKLILP